MKGGYLKRAVGLTNDLAECFAKYQNGLIEISVYSMLESHEEKGSLSRLEHLNKVMAQLKAHEAVLQKRYGELIVERRRLAAKS